MSNSNNHKGFAGNHRTNADSAQLHLQERRMGPSSYVNVPFTSGTLGRGSGSQSERPIADWPLPPGYSGMHGDTSQEMDDLRPAVPHITGSAATQGQTPVRAPPTEEPFVFPFGKPRKTLKRRYYIALFVFLLIVVGFLAIVFDIKKEHKDQTVTPSPASSRVSPPLTTTLVFTEVISTTLISTEFVSSSSILGTTISEVSTTTQVTTQPTMIIESTTIFRSTTLIDSTIVVESTTQVQLLTLRQSSTVTQVWTSVQNSTLTTSFPVTTVTETTTVVITLTYKSTDRNRHTSTILRPTLSTERLSRTSVTDLFKMKVSTNTVQSPTPKFTTKRGIPSAAAPSSTAGP